MEISGANYRVNCGILFGVKSHVLFVGESVGSHLGA